MRNLKPVAIGISAFIYSLLTLQTALADDTEIYVPKDLPADQQVRPNILFILDSSGSMDSNVAGTKPKKTRNQVMRSVVKDLIDDLKVKEDVNVGFMRFRGINDNQGGHVLSPVQRLTSLNATAMKDIVDDIPAVDWTPLSETYYEAYRYMAGLTPVWGASRSIDTSMSGGKYISPITHSCQRSHIIYVTDGEPTYDQGSNSDIRALVTNKNTLYTAASCGPGHGQCLPHLAEYMANQDLAPAPTFSDPTNRSQTVTSHFVGFTVDLPLLQNAAAAGGGKYYTSNNVSGLTDALKAIIVDITAENTSFAAPSVAVSAFNNLGFRNDLYYALFRPAEGANWPGNVKRYKLSKDVSGNPLIVDKNGNAAIDDSTGFFSNSASSFWSTADGSDVSKGGVAGRLLSPDSRKIFTWTAADRTPTAADGVTGSQALDTSVHRLITSNSAVTEALLGASSSTQRTNFINWARGKKSDGSARLAIADVLHNEPKLVAYVTDEDLDRVANSPATTTEQLYMFFGSNEGFIHAIDPTTGDEKFAFIPKELLPNPGAYLTDAKGSAAKKYGMDGQINLWTEYRTQTTADITDKKRVLDKAYLYAGMRRGGSNYYSLDVTDIDAPAFKWVIKGAYSASPTPGFENLGLTFSAPKLADVKIDGTKTKVLIFTGGYDKEQDNIGDNLPKNDSVGNSLFIADADTGKLLWRAGSSGANLNIATMTNSMPADPAIVDINGDGLADIVYASDLRGQVFRFDINNNNTGLIATGANAFAAGGRIASLGGATAADNRRFFSSPDVALIRERGGKTYFTISLGSGFRESPLNEDTDDRFYVLRDSNVFNKPGTYTTIVQNDLVDVSSIDLTAAESTQILADIATLEAQMAALNTALADAQANFTAYKASSGHTAKQNQATQAYSDANAKQRQIDDALESDPYLVEHAPNTQQQSLLQNSLSRANEILAALEQARIDAQALADATDHPALISAANDAQVAYSDALDAYDAAQLVADADAADASTKETAAVDAEAIAATAAQAAADALIAKDAAEAAAASAAADVPVKQQALDDANAVLATATTDEGNAATAEAAAQTALTAAQDAVAAAQTDRDNAQTDYDNVLATNGGDTSHPDVIAAQTQLDQAQADLVTAQSDETDANTALATATQTLTDATSAKAVAQTNADNAQTAKNAADVLATDTATAATDAATALTTADTAATDAAATAAPLRADADAATAVANTSAADAATKLTASQDAAAARDAAVLAMNTAQTDDEAAAALTIQRDRLALEYEKLINLQTSVDSAFALVLAKEQEITAALADPSFPSDDIPALEAELETLRSDYAASADIARRTDLNSGTPTKALVSLDAVNAALAAGDATAVAAALLTALDALEISLDMTGTASLSVADLIARDELSKSTALAEKAGNESTTAALIATLESQRSTLLAAADALQAEADALAATAYDVSSALLSGPQQTAAEAQVAPAALTMFAAYQFLIDAALANASNPDTGIPHLRTEINNKYAELTPGNSYTPNTNLLAASKGFYLRLPRGEKVLSSSLSFRGTVLFSTFSPRGQAVSTCGSDVGRGRTYALSLIDASAIYTETVAGVKTPTRSFDLKRSGIPPTPSVILSEGEPTVLTGTEILEKECVDGAEICRGGDAVKATYWREN